MDLTQPRVFTLPPDADFLREVAHAVLAGFPLQVPRPPDPLTELPRWTILLPTRRAVRELERILLDLQGGRGSLLPRIKPLGDIDEDLLAAPPDDTAGWPGLSDAISPPGRELALMGLIDEWSRENPQSALAREIAGSTQQTLALAVSLAEFIDALETEQIDQSQIPQLFGLESARHREAILDFLSLARLRLPMLLRDWKLTGPKERQSQIIRHEAQRLAQSPPRWPIIAAGSTGTIPATRELLRAIARAPTGAVVLPGLDQGVDDASWTAVGPQHPQYALKQLLDAFGIERKAVVPLNTSVTSPRQWLASEFMRPPESTGEWWQVIARDRQRLVAASAGLSMIEAADRDEEAAIIALMLREALEVRDRTAALITPDRDLARRVKQELRRWDIDIDDTAGEPLINFSGPALAGLLIDTIQSGFSAASLNALLKHPLAVFGHEPAITRQAADVLELALFRYGAGLPALRDLPSALERNRAGIAQDSHAHPLLRRIAPDRWAATARFLERIVAVLLPLQDNASQDFKTILEQFVETLEAIAGPPLWSDESGLALHRLFDIVLKEAQRAVPCTRDRALVFLHHHLRTEAFRPSCGQTPRLAVYGLLEARLMRADLHVLGGLNEGVWPALPDSGPWLNRPMRSMLNMQLPERAIGQTAHDLVQAMGAPEVRLTWSRRIGDSPAIPSRWILRLKMLLSNGEDEKNAPPSKWAVWARQFEWADRFAPCSKPKPKPPVAVRPKGLSVTRIETLIRDPYAIYARHVLGLQAIAAISTAPDARLRGVLYHQAIGDFLKECRTALPPDPLHRLLELGRQAFAPHADIPLIAAFWWPRFERIAAWLIEHEREERLAIAETFAEVAGAHLIDLQSGGQFRLTCRADRIDILRQGGARIFDYKTGATKSASQIEKGFAPQLTLEAAMLGRGGFKGLAACDTSDISYVKLGGGDPAGEVKEIKFTKPLMDIANYSLSRLTGLLDHYDIAGSPYLPRTAPEKVDDEGEYDHLSRYREWLLSGTRT